MQQMLDRIEGDCSQPQSIIDQSLESVKLYRAAPHTSLQQEWHEWGGRLVRVHNTNVCDLRGGDRNTITQWFEDQTHPTPDVTLRESIRTAP
jgi:hypothetical protein